MRRDRDSNPGCLAAQRFSRPPQSTTLPPLQILNDIQDSYVSFKSGETGIRTPGTSQYNGFQDRRNRPLCHLSKASIDHSATSPKLRYALPKHFLSKAMQRYDLFSIVQTFKKLFLIRLQIFFLHLPLCKLRRRNIRQCKAVWYQTDKQFEKFSGTK